MHSNRLRSLALVLAATAVPLAACSERRDAPPPPVDDTRGGIEARHQPAPPPRSGMSTRSKLVVLGGAAALYYMYKHHQHAQVAGVDGQYYLSKNGRVYYRDAEHRAHWVTPPPSGIQVPASEAREYQQFEGYDNQTTGRDLSGLASDNEPMKEM